MFTNNLIAGASGNQGGFYPQEIEQSLRFNDDDSAYLTRTPASAGNRKTWTFSTWFKLGNIETDYISIIEGFTGASDVYNTIALSSNQIWVNQDNGSGGVMNVRTSALFRDPSAWYHLVVSVDTTQATSTNRVKIYVNGVNQSVTFNVTPAQNLDTWINGANGHRIGARWNLGSTSYYDGYLGEVNFIDGTALAASDFGEFKSGVWVAKEYTGSYGTNGFYLPFKQTTVANGFNAVTYTGTGAIQSVEGVGFQPDLVWIKSRTSADWHAVFDTIRGADTRLSTNETAAESTTTYFMTSFDADGFTAGGTGGTSGSVNGAGNNYVAWCWDAGSGSPASNTNGSITSTVKSNTAYGFSVVSYVGSGSGGDSVGHGLGVAPDLVIFKARDTAGRDWGVVPTFLGDQRLFLNSTAAAASGNNGYIQSTTSTTMTLGTNLNVNGISGENYIAYCFAEISGYSSIGSYTGNGSTSGPTVTTGFKPAFVMVKRTDTTGQWFIWDDVRSTSNTRNKELYPNASNAELTVDKIDFLDTGFQLRTTGADNNASGGTYIYMAFADTRDAAFWRDLSGNDNTWQPNYLQNSDVMPDSPTNNFATFNPLNARFSSASTQEGNLRWVKNTSTDFAIIYGNFGMSSGKWYMEVDVKSRANFFNISVANSSRGPSTDADNNMSRYRLDIGYLQKRVNSGTSTIQVTGASTSAGIIGIAFDADNGTCAWYHNNSLQGTVTGLNTDETYFLQIYGDGSNNNANVYINHGQDSSFAGTRTPQGNTDDNGVGDFFYAPPSGYLALCTANLPDPAIDPAQDDVPSDYFNTVLYTGNGVSSASGGQAITGVGYQPDMVWTKQRSSTTSHMIHDVVRGAGADKSLSTNSSNGEPSNGEAHLMSFDTDGFTVGHEDSGSTNVSGGSYVAWNWLAANGTSSNTSGSISSTVSVNEKAGFSIASWTGTGITGATVGHGLNQKPSALIIKNRTTANRWLYYTDVIDGTYDFLELNSTAAATSSSLSLYTSSVFSVFNAADSNSLGDNFIAYCFAPVESYSAFGSYTGNGSTDGPFVYTGFRPAWVMIKRTSAIGSWWMWDDQRKTFNVNGTVLRANDSAAEADNAAYYLDLLSNGFKLRGTDSNTNGSGSTYIYMAFAENPFKYANAR